MTQSLRGPDEASPNRFGIAALIALPLVVAVAAGAILDALADRQHHARDARLAVTQLRETVRLQETLVSHAMSMDHLTADLPGRLAQLRADGVRQLEAYLRLAASDPVTAELDRAWDRHMDSVDRRMRHLSDGMHDQPDAGDAVTADHMAHPGSGDTMAADHMAHPGSGDTMAADHMADRSPAEAMGPHGAPASAPEAQHLLDLIGDIDQALRDRVTQATELASRGSATTVALVALILALAFWQAGRRRAVAVIEADRRSEARFRSLVQNASDVIVVVEPDSTILYHTPSAERLLGGGRLRGTHAVDLFDEDERERFGSFVAAVSAGADQGVPVAFRLATRDGRWVDVEIVASNLLDDPSVRGVVLTARDVTERTLLEERLVHQAFHDSLTGLANRKLFVDRVTRALGQRTADEPVSVLFCDVDDFKVVNDSLGHAPGDRVLSAIGERLAHAVRAGDTVARLGGDEFAVLLAGSDADEARATAERLLAEIRRPILLEDDDVRVDASIGVATQRTGDRSADELLRDADLAMYLAKDAGKGQAVVFEPHMHDLVHDRMQLKADLQGAVERGELRVQYQPSFDLRSGEVSGLEALVRWQHPERGLIPPDQFIPLAEETGVIHAIGGWVLGRACVDARTWQRQGGPEDVHISVNVSTRQLERDDIVHQVARALQSSGLDPALLTLEITETAVLTIDDTLIDRLHALKDLGVRLAVDDFGTGYSSLSYVRRLPVDVVKIDRSFVSSLDSAGNSRALVATIIELARALGLQTVAEGVEHADQADFLRHLGCELVQGFLYARPLDPERITADLRSGAVEPADGDATTMRALTSGIEPR